MHDIQSLRRHNINPVLHINPFLSLNFNNGLPQHRHFNLIDFLQVLIRFHNNFLIVLFLCLRVFNHVAESGRCVHEELLQSSLDYWLQLFEVGVGVFLLGLLQLLHGLSDDLVCLLLKDSHIAFVDMRYFYLRHCAYLLITNYYLYQPTQKRKNKSIQIKISSVSTQIHSYLLEVMPLTQIRGVSWIIRCWNNKIINIYNITFHRMKLQSQLNRKAQQDLKQILDNHTLQCLKRRLNQQKCNETYSSKILHNQGLEIRTPSTVDTTLRRRGNAIAKSIRPDSRSKGKARPTILTRPSLNSQNAVTRCTGDTQHQVQQQSKNEINWSSVTLNRKLQLDRAVYYGNVELPYLHSSDAISCLYQKSKSTTTPQQPLINPPPNLPPSLLTNLKNLHLYYTQIDSLRQLGTGWSNLKTLTIACSPLLLDLSGLSIFPSLQYLFVPHNNIREISDIMYHSGLRCVDLEGNRIEEIQQIQYLYTIGNLEWVDVTGNPVMRVKEKYRIVCENLGKKMQVEDWNRDFQWEMECREFESEINSYANIQGSNCLIREINDQIMKEQIKVGDHWRGVQQKIQNIVMEVPAGADVEILQSFQLGSDEEEPDASYSSSPNKNDRLQLRVTPLIDYAKPIISVEPLKKYFYNKVCPQDAKTNKEKQEPIQQKMNNADSKQIVEEPRIKKFAATQKLTASTSQQKKRLTSVSLKKRLSKLSLSKNTNCASTISSVLSTLKPKQDPLFNPNGITMPSNLKFLGKRKLINKISQQIF